MAQPVQPTLNAYWFPQTERREPRSAEGGVKQRKRTREGPEEGPHPAKSLRTSAGPPSPHVEVVDSPVTHDDCGVTESSSGPPDTPWRARGDEFIVISSSSQTSPTSCSTAGRKRTREGPEEGPHPPKSLRSSAGPPSPHVEVVALAGDSTETHDDSGVTGSSSRPLDPLGPLSGACRARGDSFIIISSSTQTSPTSCSTAGRKRTREGPEEGPIPSKRTRASTGPPAHHVEVLAKVSSESRDDTWISVGGESSPQGAAQTSPCTQNFLLCISTDVFEMFYQQLGPLGKGGYGSVYAGYRKCDRLPVAIKHIPMGKVEMILVERDGELLTYPMEVFLMLKAAEGQAESEGPGSVVNLINWIQVDQELILVQERPEASVDLLKYIGMKGNKLPEQEAKMILRQVVNGVVALHAQKVLHRDIKPENILVGTASGHPRVRLIDLGCGCPLEDVQYKKFEGTLTYAPPEWLERGSYRADPMTVWQFGILLFQLLTGGVPFWSTDETLQMTCPPVGCKISQNCQDFLDRCLSKRPLGRPALSSLLSHPWLHL